MESAEPARVPTSTTAPGVENASALLARVAAATSIDLDAALTAGDVIFELSNVVPPLPPLPPPQDVCANDADVQGAITAAVEELTAGVSSTADAREALRAGLAVHTLRGLLERRADPDVLVYPVAGPR